MLASHRFRIRLPIFGMDARQLSLIAMVVALAFSVDAQASEYLLGYRIELLPDQGIARVGISLGGDPKALPSRLEFTIEPGRHSAFSGTGTVRTPTEESVRWEPPNTGGRLNYEFRIDRERGSKGYDARMTASWALFRADHLVPSVTVRAPAGAESVATVEFVLPDGWSVLTAYPEIDPLHVGQGGQDAHGRKVAQGTIDDADRRFDRPKGWLFAGKIGSRRETIAGSDVVVAGPTGQGLRRVDTLAMLNWTLPHLAKVFPNLPPRILIVMARDPMWRGGLSGPRSLFLHGDRPLISENRTSTLLHELVHVLSGIHADHESDWIVEGMAEFYSTEILRRSGGISQERFEKTMKQLAAWGRRAKTLFVTRSTAETTARGAVVFYDLDREIREATGGKKSLDDVARKLASTVGDVTFARLVALAEEAAGRPVVALEIQKLRNRAAPVPKTTPKTVPNESGAPR